VPHGPTRFGAPVRRFRCPQTLARALASALIAACAGGCQSYQPKPLDLQRHAAAFAERVPDAPTVRDYAAGLRAEAQTGGPASDPAGTEPARFDLTDGLSLREGEAVALAFNASLRLERARAGVTLATAENSGLWDDPTLGVDLTRILASVPNPWKVMSSVGLTLPISGRLEQEKARDGAAHIATLAALAEKEWQTRIDLRDQWARWSGTVRRVGLAEDLLSKIEPIVALARRLEEAGELPRVEARLFAVEAATRRGDLLSAKAAQREGRLAILNILGLAPTADVPLESALATSQVTVAGKWATTTTRTPAGNTADALDHSPTLATAVAEYETAERSLALQVQKQYPDLTFGPGYGNEDGNDEVLLGLTLPLPIWNANRKGIAEATAQRSAAQVRVEQVVEHLRSELAIASLRLEAAQALRQMLELEVSPLVDAQYEDVRAITRLGEFNALILLDTIVRQFEAKIRLTDAAVEEQLSSNRVSSVVGPVPSGMVARDRSNP